MEAYLTLALTPHASQDESLLLIWRILGREFSDNRVDDSAPASEMRIRGTVHKPVLVSYKSKRRFSQPTQLDQHWLVLMIKYSPYKFKCHS